MNTYDYIESRAIRRHLQKTGYKFSSLEAAWLVWFNSKMTMSEKHKAWKKIIKYMPDMEIRVGKKGKEVAFDSLHRFLTDYMAMERRWLKDFFAFNQDSVLSYSFLKKNKEPCAFHTESVIYNSYKKCLGDMKDDIERYAEDNIGYIKFSQRELNGNDGYDVILDCMCRVISVEPVDFEEDDYNIWYCFWNFPLMIPTPFERGDIVYSPSRLIDTSLSRQRTYSNRKKHRRIL